MTAIEVLAIVVTAATGVAFVTLTGLSLLDEGRRLRFLGRFRRRSWRAERTAFEASLEAPEFDPDGIRAAIAAKLAALADPALLAELPDGVWVVRDITDAPASEATLSAPLVPGPWADVERLRTESTLELAAADSLETDRVDPALIDTTRPPADALADLALVDARFGTHVLDVVVGRLIEAWEAGQLHSVASRAAATRLLHPARAPHASTVVHDLDLTSWAPRVLHATDPTQLDLWVQLEGIRYVTAPGEAALLAGSQRARHPLHLTWTLTLVADPAIVWRLDATTDPASELHWLA